MCDHVPRPSPPSHVPDRPPFQVLMAASQQSPTQSCITESKGSCGPGTARSTPCLTHLGFRETLGSRLRRSHPLPQGRRLRVNNKWPALNHWVPLKRGHIPPPVREENLPLPWNTLLTPLSLIRPPFDHHLLRDPLGPPSKVGSPVMLQAA